MFLLCCLFLSGLVAILVCSSFPFVAKLTHHKPQAKLEERTVDVKDPLPGRIWLSSRALGEIPIKLVSQCGKVTPLKEVCPRVVRDVVLKDEHGKVLAAHVSGPVFGGQRSVLGGLLSGAPRVQPPLGRGKMKGILSVEEGSLGRPGSMFLQGPTHYGQNYRVLRGGKKRALAQKGKFRRLILEAQAVARMIAPSEVAALEADVDLTMWGSVTPCPTVALDTGLWHMLHRDPDADVAWFLVHDQHGEMRGGEFALGQLGVAFEVRSGDFVLFNPRLQHSTCHSWAAVGRKGGRGTRRVSGCLYQSRAAATACKRAGPVPILAPKKRHRKPTPNKITKQNKKKKITNKNKEAHL